ncbi:hypothetical protein PG994_013217 [Apiospora phragmitis]|uniref:Uncharacterized protein n=1 Tax=Apiospora phragmitis TaxID=2905665 RepID=A0ABR1T803_9PEZI
MSLSASFSGIPGEYPVPPESDVSASFNVQENKFTIRFIGTCQLPKRPIDCFQVDLASGTSGILPEFQTALEFLYPDISGQIHILVDANVNGTCSHNVEDAERVLVEFFDPDSLLNRHLADTGTEIHPLTDPIKRVQLNQATPTPQCRNLGTLMVFIGNGIALEDYVGQRGFMTGKSRAAALTKDTLSNLARMELQRLDLAEEDDWTGTFDTSTPIATDLLQKYLLIVGPLIVNTYSKTVSSIARANFLHEFGLPRSSFIEHVGELTVQYYSNGCWVDEGCEGPDADTAFINIPHVDPELDKYGKHGSAEFRRVFYMTMQMTFLVASTAINVTQDIHPGAELSRYDICQLVVDRVNNTLQTTPEGQKFTVAFKKAKTHLERYPRNRRVKLDRISEHSWRQMESQELIAKIGFACGQPHSGERYDDLLRLWNENVPEIQLAVPHDHKSTWMQQLLPLQQGQSYFLVMAAQVPENDQVRQILSYLRYS